MFRKVGYGNIAAHLICAIMILAVNNNDSAAALVAEFSWKSLYSRWSLC